MTGGDGVWLYPGVIVHERVRPTPHRFAYRVLAIGADLDRVGEFARRTWGFGYNRAGLMSLRDRDHGDGRTPLADQVRLLLADAGMARAGARIVLVCYPRVLGYVFNPVSVFFCSDASGAVAAMIYEVTNTYGERRSYVVPAGPARDGVYDHHCDKTFSVSPFTPGRGTYRFVVAPPDDEVLIGIRLRDAAGPLLRTHFRGTRVPLTNRSLVRHLGAVPLATLKVSAAIHWQALRLIWKGLPVQPRHRSPVYSVEVAEGGRAEPRDPAIRKIRM